MNINWNDRESVELALDYVERADEVVEWEDDMATQLRSIRDEVLNGNVNAVRRLHAQAKGLLAFVRFILDNTSAMEQLEDIRTKAEKLLTANINNKVA